MFASAEVAVVVNSNRFIRHLDIPPRVLKKLNNHKGGHFLLTLLKHRLTATTNDLAEDLGYAVLGPLVVGFCDWLKIKSANLKIPQLLFLARDMKLTYDVWQLLNQNSNIQSQYLLTSRRTATIASIESLDNMLALVREIKFAQPINHYFSNRLSFQLNTSHLALLKKVGISSLTQPIRFSQHLAQLQQFISLIWQELQPHISKERTAYLQYLEEKNILSGAAVTDLGYSGTIQKYLSLLTRKKLCGLYIGTNTNIKKLREYDLYFDSFLIHQFNHRSNHSFFRNLPLIEYMFLDAENSLMCFSQQGSRTSPVFYNSNELILQHRARLIERIHRGAKIFALDWQNNFNTTSLHDAEIAFAMCKTILDQPSKAVAQLFAGHCFEDNYGTLTKTAWLLASEEHFSIKKNYAIKISQWKSAAYTLANKKWWIKFWLSKLKRTCRGILFF